MTEQTKKGLIEQNNELAQYLKTKVTDPNVSTQAKDAIERCLGDTPEAKLMERKNPYVIFYGLIQHGARFFCRYGSYMRGFY